MNTCAKCYRNITVGFGEENKFCAECYGAILVPTLRDQFAMAALRGLIAVNTTKKIYYAEMAYKIADNMLKARE